MDEPEGEKVARRLFWRQSHSYRMRKRRGVRKPGYACMSTNGDLHRFGIGSGQGVLYRRTLHPHRNLGRCAYKWQDTLSAIEEPK
jgi:hypothetical protein